MRIAALCVALATLALSASVARADSADPLFTYYAGAEKEGSAHSPYPAPGGFEGPCGLAVDSLGDFYVADYYRHDVDVLGSSLAYLAQLSGVDPLDGPCGLAIGKTGGALYVNDYHRDVVKYVPSSFPFVSKTPYGAGVVFDSEHPTGVAVDPLTGDVYVDDRTYIAAYEPSGAPVEVGGEPLRIGLGSLQDGYGLAVSGYPGTEGFLYAADAATGTVKVYDPATSTENPVEVIDGSETPAGGFVSLRDAALAVDRVSGEVYFADDLQPEYYERPEAAVYAFEASGAYDGRLKYNIVDARPPGLAVDNSATATQGRVYVTSGNSEGAFVYAYAPGALTTSVFPAQGAAVSSPGGASGASGALAAASAAAGVAGAGGQAPLAAPSPRVRQRLHARRRHRSKHSRHLRQGRRR
jgi:DNA-binding beta-propeller fold protein YncE